MDTFSAGDLERIVRNAVERAQGTLIGGSQNTVNLHLKLSDESTVTEALLTAIATGGVNIRVSDHRTVKCNCSHEAS